MVPPSYWAVETGVDLEARVIFANIATECVGFGKDYTQWLKSLW